MSKNFIRLTLAIGLAAALGSCAGESGTSPSPSSPAASPSPAAESPSAKPSPASPAASPSASPATPKK